MSRFLDDLEAARADRERRGLTRSPVPRGPDGPEDSALLDLAGNDYLGLSRHRAVVAGAVAAARAYGAGARASRLVTGTTQLHLDLEAALVSLMGTPSALVFSTGYQANLGALSALTALKAMSAARAPASPSAPHRLPGAGALVVSDAHVHASLIDGCRLSLGEVVVVPHNDVAAVERALAARTTGPAGVAQPAIVVVESVYSVLGDAAPLADLAEVTQRYGAVLLVDEAHALGVVGAGGRGLCAKTGISALPEVVITVTLSKSLAAQGGAVLGHPAVREHLVNTARPFIYDTGLAPPAAGAALAALRVLARDPGLPEQALANAATLAQAFGVPDPVGAVLSVPVPGPREALAAVAECERHGIRIGCFRPPSTPDGSSRLRLTAHADHTAAQMDDVVPVLKGLLHG